MTYVEDDLLPLSALQHLIFCERQCALIHIEQQWRDNALTVEGTHMHARVDVDGPRREMRGKLVILRSLALRSFRLGLVGRADVVELHAADFALGSKTDLSAFSVSTTIMGLPGRWVLFPAEYKRGKPKADRCDDVQLCAQALCLEEILGVHVARGALFYGRKRRRHAVPFDRDLRKLTESTAARLHDLIGSQQTPLAHNIKKCESCSMLPVCMPETVSVGRSAATYLTLQIRQHFKDTGSL